MQSLVGVWKLVEAHAFDATGRELPPPLGPQPIGIVLFEAERMVAAISATIESRCRLIAYTGTYHFDGVELATQVEDASQPELIVEQVRRIRFESPTRMVAVPVSGVTGSFIGVEIAWGRVGSG
jgi:hypothetical protein